MTSGSVHNEDTETISGIKAGIARGEEYYLGLLHQLYFRKLLSFAQTFFRSKETAEEIVDDLFIKIWAKRAHIPQIHNLNVYLYKSIKNRALNEISRQASQLKTEPLEAMSRHPQDDNATTLDHLILAEMMQSVELTIESLPQRCKQIFKLIREDGLKYKEVAEILNISVNTIDNQMAIAVKRICASLSIQKTRKGQNITG